MSSGKIINFVIILQAVLVQSKEFQIKRPLLSKLVNSTLFKYDFEHTTPENYDQIKKNCMSKSVSLYRRNGARSMRFTDPGTNDSYEEHEMEAPAAKHSFLDLLTEEGGEEDEEKEKNDDALEIVSEEVQLGDEEIVNSQKKKYEIKEKLKKDEDEDEDDDDDDDDNIDDEDYELDFLSDDDNDNNKVKVDDTNISASKDKIKGEGKWPRQRFRRRKKFQGLIFSLLLAYKLKFFTVIPFLIGILILLLGTTSLAGFFFALFSAALGLHNTHFHH